MAALVVARVWDVFRALYLSEEFKSELSVTSGTVKKIEVF